ncbi:MAG: hypothetical protein H5U01_15580 [Clostridia bacterium]|nr:hypothetical protein [Clostridia bacterium]
MNGTVQAFSTVEHFFPPGISWESAGRLADKSCSGTTSVIFVILLFGATEQAGNAGP